MSAHFETGEALPKAMLDKLLAAKNFQSGMALARQLEFSLFDFRLHLEYNPSNPRNPQDLINEVRDQIAVIKAPDYNRFQHSFGHIFAGGYAAGYYSYLWAEVLSADAFSLFEEEGIFDQATGDKFRTAILEKGCSDDAMNLFVEFRGREPSNEALLRHRGIA
jgi:oligopeptidase A